ncbi:MAG: acetoacetate--CoA ligase [Coxiellaceae bacterium]|nr:acetoacetate--CoA ligase [Coxiellaceae bacterium]
MNTSPLWTPNVDTLSETHLHHFMQLTGKQTYDALYQWSIDYPCEFWKLLSKFSDIIFSQAATTILQPHAEIQKTQWFIDATLNFAENLLWKGKVSPDATALRYANESGERAQISYHELSLKVTALAAQLKSDGLQPGDRVAAFVTNRIETVIAMLATTSLGAIWSACGPEFGADALIERFSQIEPVILFTISTHDYNGKKFHHEETIASLQNKIPSIKKVIFLETINRVSTETLRFYKANFNHPLYILYSSGTTGKPKCIVHGAGNTLIQHKKELMLHTDLHEKDILFFYTTCSWMMWHWMISGLSVGATLVLYDGSPTYPSNTALLDIVDELNVSIFGCGAKMIETYLKNDLKPKDTHQLTHLKTLLTTGSPLLKESFDYIYRDIKKEVRVSSISGGSDIISCFALGNPLLPVYAEELQCRGLGMAVEIFDDNGKSVVDQTGELVCTKPFPSMPIYFWNDATGEKYFNAYFKQFKNIWTHGDYAKITQHHGVIIYGRSDTTLNPGGVRIGTADIYEQALKIPEIIDCVAAGKQNKGDEDIFLFVKLKDNLILDETLISTIKKIIREHTSPYHVPKKIIQVTDIPKTMNGKTMELAVKNKINGRAVKNTESLLNPNCLTQFNPDL